MSSRHIAEHFNCSKRSINRLLLKYEEHQTVEETPGRGRKRKTTNDEDGDMVRRHDANPFLPATTTAINFEVSPQTVRRRLRENGFQCRRPYIGSLLTERHREARLEWAERHERWFHPQWSSVLFTDESRFKVFFPDGRVRTWRRGGLRFNDPYVMEMNRFGGGGVMVWAGISSHHRTELVFLDGRVDARRYTDEILRDHVVPFFREHDDVTIFQQDNARPHSARLTQDFLWEQDFDILDWPALSPDLSPIEHFWDELGRRVRKRRDIRTVHQLQEALHEEYHAIPQQLIEKLIRSMSRRVQACIGARGGHTRY